MSEAVVPAPDMPKRQLFGCHGKVAFITATRAFMVAKRMRKRRGHHGKAHGLTPYACPICQRWHIGGGLK